MSSGWGRRTGISSQRERGTGVAIVERRDTKAGMVAELAEIDSYLDNTDAMPLNKTEHERLRRRRKRILQIFGGRNARWAVMSGRPGRPRKHEQVPYEVKKRSMEMLDLLDNP